MRKIDLILNSYTAVAFVFASFLTAHTAAHADLAQTPFSLQKNGMQIQASLAIFSETPEVPYAHAHLSAQMTTDQAACFKEEARQLSLVLNEHRFAHWFGKMGLNQVSIGLTEESNAAKLSSVHFDQLNGSTTLTISIQRDPQAACDQTVTASAEKIEEVLKSEERQLISSYQKSNSDGVEELKRLLPGFPENLR